MIITILFAAVAVASPADLASPLLDHLSLWTEKPGAFVEYQVASGESEPGSSVRLAVMTAASGKPKNRWVRMTVTVGVERVDLWALAEEGPNGMPVRKRTLVRLRDRVAELPGEAPPSAESPSAAKPEWRGREKIKVPAGEFDARLLVVKAEGAEVKLWAAPGIPFAGKAGGIVRMEGAGGTRWDLIASGIGPVEPPPAATETPKKTSPPVEGN